MFLGIKKDTRGFLSRSDKKNRKNRGDNDYLVIPVTLVTLVTLVTPSQPYKKNVRADESPRQPESAFDCV